MVGDNRYKQKMPKKKREWILKCNSRNSWEQGLHVEFQLMLLVSCGGSDLSRSPGGLPNGTSVYSTDFGLSETRVYSQL